MRSSKLIMKSNAQKQMAKFSLGCKFHDINYFEIDFIFYALEVIVERKKLVEDHQFNSILSCLE
jgi:hypothetical protein